MSHILFSVGSPLLMAIPLVWHILWHFTTALAASLSVNGVVVLSYVTV